MIIIGFHSRVSKWNQVILLLPTILENFNSFEHTRIITIYVLDNILVLIMVKNI